MAGDAPRPRPARYCAAIPNPPSKVLEIWLGELRYAHANAAGGLLTVTVHPECIGRGHRMTMLEAFIAEAKSMPGVVFERLDTYVTRWLASTPPPASGPGR